MMKLSKEQKLAVELALDSSVKSLFVTGEGGTGKSAVIKNIVKQLNVWEYILLAPTQSASLNVGGETLHSFFKIKPTINLHVEKEEDVLSFDLEELQDDLAEGKIIIVDEVSMLGDTMLKGIFERITPKKLILFGDPEQLEPVKDNAVNWSAFCEKTVVLTHNYRFQNETLREVVSTYRDLGELSDKAHIIDGIDDVNYDDETLYIAHTNKSLSDLQTNLMGYSNAKFGDVLLTFGSCDQSIKRKHKNKRVPYFVNNELVTVVGQPREIEAGLFYCDVLRTDGDKIIENQYNKKPAVIVGDYDKYKKTLERKFKVARDRQQELFKRYHVKSSSALKAKATFEENDELRIKWITYFSLKNSPYARHHQFRTTYKSQGQSFKKVLIDWFDLPTKQHRYVAMSRAMDNLTVLKN